LEDDVPLKTLGFLLITLVWFFPWSFLLPAAWRYGFRRPSAPGDSGSGLLVGLWVVVVVGFFSLVSSRLEHYVLPAIPPLSLMVGGLWQDSISFERTSRRLKVWLGCAAAWFFFLGVFLFLTADRLTTQMVLNGLAKLNVYYRILKAQGAVFPFSSLTPFIQMLKSLGTVLAIGWPLAFGLLYFRMPRASFSTLLSIAGLIGALVLQLLWVIEPHHSVRVLASELRARDGPEATIVHEGSLEYSGGLPFYTGKRILVLNGKRGDLEFGSRYEEAKDVFVDTAGFARLWQSAEPVFLVSRFNPSRSAIRTLPGEKVFLVGQYGSRRLYSNRRVVPD
jgi:4-amino-4-deoxy-L-arabinose transferase-like glycosyltransferase